ncbi:acyl-ACP--UDP-N-acetylglucosamine O-acyltransferase [Synechococcus sp. PCC 6312]|uniref:acyl-ACP--UDP-N-acetylglucosamine O-acyltransferase n=1 Tax=Synechococcus sp. (strain ATCC 27167 / PCC 6312) TaxID=195253 RepID=UPI00029EF469|nr:acyl-ACP--UDP-N-acetylglucosamine O-acyltransferase [Synechococcus sp. PCC 6312]AFY59692.1 acyl-(acyl-carrier-protein)--UDP-N-acetylglucosamine O-acyltransferase [Synechococcus sp. PCC 6312]
MGIHPTAIIESGAKLGAGVEIGPFCYVAATVEIGPGTILGPHVTLLGHTTIGQNCQIHSGAVIGDLPQDFAYQGGRSYVQIGDQCQIREGVTIHRGTGADSQTLVGNHCLLMANSHLAHNVCIGNQVTLANNALLAGYVQVGDRAFISGNCLVHQFTRIGRLAMLSGGTATQKDVPPFCMTRSLSTNTVMGLNTVGLKRAGFTLAERQILKEALHELYNPKLNITQALAVLQAKFADPLVQELSEFIAQSQRGICRFITPTVGLRPPQTGPEDY